MINKQNGFGIAGLLLVSVTIITLGFAGFYVYISGKSSTSSSTQPESGEQVVTQEKPGSNTFVLPRDWKTVNKNG